MNQLLFHLCLLIITFFSVTYRENFFMIFKMSDTLLYQILLKEIPFSASLILILFCHEMGHYIPSRFYGFRATLPYFIPMPLGPVGTMGAVIKIKDPISDKLKLFDIGVGGPVVSLFLSMICWIMGIYQSELIEIEKFAKSGQYMLYFGDSLFTYWTAQWIHGPFDPSTSDILIHPLAKAGWVGLLITAINMLPFGQLDGGHVIYSLFGENYRKWIYYLFLGFLVLSLVDFTWLLWGFMIRYIIKIEHPYVPDYSKPLNPKRKYLGYFMLFSLVITFVPNPISIRSTEYQQTTLLADIFHWIGSIF
ncbi:MAG: site-2 protease family protein [Spirochaetota bacterium]